MSQIIKKAIIPNADLPPILIDKSGYVVRYRIISEDKNRISHWSNSYTVLPNYDFITGSVIVTKQGSLASIIWDTVKINKDDSFIRDASRYDLWVKWGKDGNGDWLYKERTYGTTINLPIPTTYTVDGVVQGSAPNELSIEIFLEGVPITRDSAFLKVYSSGPHTV